jgi:hypothetical protein
MHARDTDMHQRSTFGDVPACVVLCGDVKLLHIRRLDGRARRFSHRLLLAHGSVRAKLSCHLANERVLGRHTFWLRDVPVSYVLGTSGSLVYVQRRDRGERRISDRVSIVFRSDGTAVHITAADVHQRSTFGDVFARVVLGYTLSCFVYARGCCGRARRFGYRVRQAHRTFRRYVHVTDARLRRRHASGQFFVPISFMHS